MHDARPSHHHAPAPDAPAPAATPADATAASPAHPHRPHGRRWLRVLVQGVFFAGGLALLAWVIAQAAGDEKLRAQFPRLLEAPPWTLAAIFGCSCATVAIMGLVFREVLAPVRPLRRVDLVATNGLVSLLSYAPFKIGLLVRVLIHHRRDRVPLLTIGAWLSASAAVVLLSLGPAMLATLWRGRLDAWWWLATLGGTVAGAVVMIALCRALDTPRGWALLESLAAATRVAALRRAVGSVWFKQLHGGVHMLGDARAVSRALALRGLDVAVQAARFYLVAQCVGVELTLERAVLAGASYFLIQALSPAGVAGMREGGVTAILGADFAVVVLAVSAAELCANVVLGLAGAAWLRPDRFIGAAARAQAAQPGPSGQAEPASSPTPV